jgi:E3 ubiquitin-protein ligase MARCH6
VYKWWFKSCAQFLRLSDFLFGEKVKEEEGHHVQPTWSSWFTGERAKPDLSIKEEHANSTDSAYFVFDGKYVRAPASDQVRIPKGEKVFVEVDRFNRRKDGKSEGGVHNSDLVAMVYIPPWFRIRVAAFVFTIWAFAALTGTGITIIPLLFGRYLFSLFLPSTVEMNDIHAFSLGIYTLGTLTYTVYHLYKFISGLSRPVPSPISTLVNVTTSAAKLGFRVLRFTYVWTTLVFVIPLLFAMLLELYVLMPLHAYLGSSEPHVVHIIQDWTLGFLYARLAARIIFADRTSRAARAFSALIAEGYMNPNARLATRCFLLPVCAFFCIAVAFPAALAWTMNHSLYSTASTGTKSQVWRFSFPVHAVALVTIWVGHESAVMVNRWRMVVRDEVYLIGERLHNFKDRKTSVVTEGHAITT